MTLGTESIPFWLKLVSPLINALRSLRFLVGRRSWKLVFVERSRSGWLWSELSERRIVHLRCQLAVTNRAVQDKIVPVRAQVGLGSFAYLRALQDCGLCAIGGEYVVPSHLDVIEPRTTAVMEITHPFEVKVQPRTKMLSFWIVGDRPTQ